MHTVNPRSRFTDAHIRSTLNGEELTIRRHNDLTYTVAIGDRVVYDVTRADMLQHTVEHDVFFVRFHRANGDCVAIGICETRDDATAIAAFVS